MSFEIFVNTLSANWQFMARDQLEHAVRSLVSCFQLVQPGLAVGTIVLTYDGNIERRALLHGSDSIESCLAKVNRDLRLEWYLKTRKARRAGAAYRRFKLLGAGEEIVGDASSDMPGAGILAGFAGTAACEASPVEVIDLDGGSSTHCVSVCDAAALKDALPKYEPNPKHRPRAYYRAGGEYVAPMTVTDGDAQRALYASLVGEDGHHYGISDAKLLKYVLTSRHPVLIYHAYEVAAHEVPASILSELQIR